jgi:hypothetical protein
MTDAFSALQYPHWLILAGAILVVLGIIGLAFRQRPPPVEFTEVAIGNEQDRSERKPEIAQANRKARLAGQTKNGWTKGAKPAPWAQERGKAEIDPSPLEELSKTEDNGERR